MSSETIVNAERTSMNRPPMIGAMLRRPWQTIRIRIHQELAAAGFDDIHPAHLALLQYPGPAGARPSDLAERAQMSKQAVNRLIGNLEDSGYLRRMPDPSDGRARTVVLTDRGDRLLASIREIGMGIERECEAHLGQERLNEIKEAVSELSEALSVRAS
jgi:DNA-binding MarR family transcriptional regulator